MSAHLKKKKKHPSGDNKQLQKSGSVMVVNLVSLAMELPGQIVSLTGFWDKGGIFRTVLELSYSSLLHYSPSAKLLSSYSETSLILTSINQTSLSTNIPPTSLWFWWC